MTSAGLFYFLIVVLSAVVVVCAFVLWRESGSSWDRLKGLFRNSLTILWARFLTLSGVALTLIVSYTSDPSVMTAIQQFIPAEYWPLVIIGVGLITELVRSRSLGEGE